jgi:hypothetical protein
MSKKLTPEVKTFGYEDLRRHAGQLDFYTRVDVDLHVALALADKSPYPKGVRLGIMKQIANNRSISLRQLSILLGWAADKAQR